MLEDFPWLVSPMTRSTTPFFTVAVGFDSSRCFRGVICGSRDGRRSGA